MLRNLLYLLIIFGFLFNLNNGEHFPECENKDETFVAVASNCSLAIHCKGELSSIVECSPTTPYFSKEDSRCYKESSVCGKRPFNSVSTTTTSTKLTSPTTSSSTTAATQSTTSKTTSSTTKAKTTTSTTKKVHISSPKPPRKKNKFLNFFKNIGKKIKNTAEKIKNTVKNTVKQIIKIKDCLKK